jgi:hypothetical protein
VATIVFACAIPGRLWRRKSSKCGGGKLWPQPKHDLSFAGLFDSFFVVMLSFYVFLPFFSLPNKFTASILQPLQKKKEKRFPEASFIPNSKFK